MEIPKEQIEYRRPVGKSEKKGELFHVKLRGGLHCIVDKIGKIIGAASHRAVARFQAQREDPDICWELSKSEHYNYSDYEHLIPEADEILKKLQELQNVKG
jgi:hypothetical protein